jgi:hypothetical protein
MATTVVVVLRVRSALDDAISGALLRLAVFRVLC